MTKVLQFDRKQQATSAESPLTLELRDFIDRVIVPVLVKEYLVETVAENKRAKRDSDVAHSDSNTAARELRAVRP